MSRSLDSRLELARARPVPWDAERSERVAQAIVNRRARSRSPLRAGLAPLTLMGAAGAAVLMLFSHVQSLRERAPDEPLRAAPALSEPAAADESGRSYEAPLLGDGGFQADAD